MLNFRRWRGHESDFEAKLRVARVEPREQFVDDLSRRVTASSGVRVARPARPLSRVAFAAALTALMVGMFASFGGVGYAASSADHTYKAVKTLVVDHKLTVKHSSAADQYGKPPSEPSTSTDGVSGEQTVAGAVAGQGTLPFTGLSLLATMLVSLVLIATGVMLRRRERTSERSK